MKIFSLQFHAILDYASVILLVASPFLFNFESVPPAKNVVYAAAILVFLMSVMTNYVGGVVRLIPMSVHLGADVALGVFLISAPWVFGFSQDTYLFHLIMGLISIVAGLGTSRKPLGNPLLF